MLIPGETIAGSATITINEGHPTQLITVKNTGDRPIQIGSHFHFFEVNKYLSFNRRAAYGYRLDIASGTAVRFEPGEEKTVALVAIAGNHRVRGLNNLTDAQINATTLDPAMAKAESKEFR